MRNFLAGIVFTVLTFVTVLVLLGFGYQRGAADAEAKCKPAVVKSAPLVDHTAEIKTLRKHQDILIEHVLALEEEDTELKAWIEALFRQLYGLPTDGVVIQDGTNVRPENWL